MFDSVLDRGNTPKSRFGLGTIISIALHAGIIGAVIWLSSMPPAEKEVEQAVTFFAAPPPPPPPPPPPAGGGAKPQTQTKPKVKPVRKPDTIVQPKEVPTEKPAEAEPTETAAADEGVEGGVEGGVVGGVAGGVVGGVIGGVLGGVVGGTGTGTDVLPFGAGMTRPKMHDQGKCTSQFFTNEARLARVEGLMIIKCTIDVDGMLKNCRAIKTLPFVTEQALKVLPTAACRQTPVTFQGRPTKVDYVFNFPMKLQ